MSAEQPLGFPVEVVGLPKDDVDTRKAEMKFRKSVESLAQIHNDISEARAIVKTSALQKDRKRYEVHVMIRLPREQFELSDEGWSLDEVFENIGAKMKRLRTKPRDKPSHNRHQSRGEMEQERFEE